jgi:hypothetical protein
MTSDSPSQSHLAFVSVADFASLGAAGGALVVNSLGRPVEFHCTSPISVNRTLQILYGKSLGGFVYCDQIGRRLLQEIKTAVDLVLIQQPELIPVAETTKLPLVFCSPSDEMTDATENAATYTFSIGSFRFAILNHAADPERVRETIERFHRLLPVDEPFERITQALDEAHAVSRQAG